MLALSIYTISGFIGKNQAVQVGLTQNNNRERASGAYCRETDLQGEVKRQEHFWHYEYRVVLFNLYFGVAFNVILLIRFDISAIIQAQILIRYRSSVVKHKSFTSVADNFIITLGKYYIKIFKGGACNIIGIVI